LRILSRVPYRAWFGCWIYRILCIRVRRRLRHVSSTIPCPNSKNQALMQDFRTTRTHQVLLTDFYRPASLVCHQLLGVTVQMHSPPHPGPQPRQRMYLISIPQSNYPPATRLAPLVPSTLLLAVLGRNDKHAKRALAPVARTLEFIRKCQRPVSLGHVTQPGQFPTQSAFRGGCALSWARSQGHPPFTV
jgi:hypothetical protein